MKYFFTLITAALLFPPSPGMAEIRKIIAEGTYTMGDGETPLVAESRALLQAKRKAIELAGTYVESYTKVNKIVLTKDEIRVVASGLMEVEILDKRRSIIGDGIKFWVRIKATVNPDNMADMADIVKDKSVMDDYHAMQAAYEKSRHEIAELKKELATVRGGSEKKRLKERIVRAERWFQAQDWLEQGKYHLLNRNHDDALVSASVAILLNPNDPDAYITRGIAYMDRGQQDEAIADFTRAIDLHPKAVIAYYNRGCSYYRNSAFEEAAKDYTQAISLRPDNAEAFVSRGRTFHKLGKEQEALSDFRKACAMGSEKGCTKQQAMAQESGETHETGESNNTRNNVKSPSGKKTYFYGQRYDTLSPHTTEQSSVHNP